MLFSKGKQFDLKTLIHTNYLLNQAELLLMDQQVEECFMVCEQIQKDFEKLNVKGGSTSALASQKERLASILRQLNRIMIEKLKVKNL